MSWEKVKLGDVLIYEQPTKYIVTSDNYDNRFSTPVLTAGKSFVLGFTNETENVYDNLPAIIFDDFTTASKFVDFPFKVKSSAMKILTCDPEKADLKFLFYLMQTINVDSEQHKRYWISMFANLEIALPPLPIQKRIAEILDAADALKRKDQELLKKYDELAQAIFIDMFGDPVKNEKGWEIKKGRDVINIIGGAAFKSEDYVSEGIPLVRIGTINKGYLDLNQIVFLSTTFLISYKKYIVEPGDLLITLTGTVGKDDYGNVFIMNDTYPKYLLNQRVAKLVVNDKILNSRFFEFLLKQKEVKSELTGVSRGVRQANISNSDIYELNIPIPPIECQLQFDEIINTISMSINKNTKTESASLFSTLVQKAFNGELAA